MNTHTEPAHPGPHVRPPRRELVRTARAAGYLLLDLPLTTAAFCVAVVGVVGSLSIVLAPVLLPITGMALRALASVERTLLERLLGIRAEEPPYPLALGRARDLRERMLHPQLWLDVAWSGVGFVFSLLTFTILVTTGATALVALTSPLWLPFMRGVDGYRSSAQELFGISGFWPDLLFNLALIPVSLLLVWVVCRWAARVQGHVAAGLLSGRATQENLAAANRAHRAGLAAEASGLRRLERDLHDGPQQQLVRLQMDLARARAAVERDPARAASVLDEAGELTRQTLDDLRQLSRGIAPPVLAERGLEEAVRERAASHPVPVRVSSSVPRDLPLSVETALYYCVTEALANVAKHAGASAVVVDLGMEGESAVATVVDDGVGAADPAAGHGLAGLVQRLEAVYGRLEVSSPAGGPTTVIARVPVR